MPVEFVTVAEESALAVAGGGDRFIEDDDVQTDDAPKVDGGKA